MFHGSMPALVTPMIGDAIDEQAFQSFVEWQIGEGSNGLVPVGTTGESPTLNHQEHKRVVELCVEVANGRVPVIAGTGSNSTAEAIDFTRHAKQAGADGALVVVPYYNKPTQEGQYQHFKAVAESADIPVIIYNVPPRSAADMSVETMGRLFRDVSNIVGVKDATANLARVSRQRHEIGADFIQLSGEDATALGFNAHGGQGCISVTANVAPRLCAEFQSACASGDYAAAIEIQDRLLPLHDALFVETSPGPVKYAVSKLGKCGEFARLPMVPIDDASRKAVDDAMRHAGVSNN